MKVRTYRLELTVEQLTELIEALKTHRDKLLRNEGRRLRTVPSQAAELQMTKDLLALSLQKRRHL